MGVWEAGDTLKEHVFGFWGLGVRRYQFGAPPFYHEFRYDAVSMESVDGLRYEHVLLVIPSLSLFFWYVHVLGEREPAWKEWRWKHC